MTYLQEGLFNTLFEPKEGGGSVCISWISKDQQFTYGVVVPPFQKKNMCFPGMEEKGTPSGLAQNSLFCLGVSPLDSLGAVPQAHTSYVFTLPKHLEQKNALITQIIFPSSDAKHLSN